MKHKYTLTSYLNDREGYPETEFFETKAELLEALKAKDELAYNDYVDREMAYGIRGTYQIQFIY